MDSGCGKTGARPDRGRSEDKEASTTGSVPGLLAMRDARDDCLQTMLTQDQKDTRKLHRGVLFRACVILALMRMSSALSTPARVQSSLVNFLHANFAVMYSLKHTSWPVLQYSYFPLCFYEQINIKTPDSKETSQNKLAPRRIHTSRTH